MFQSVPPTLSQYANERKTLTYLCIIMISASLLYLATIMWNEINSKMKLCGSKKYSFDKDKFEKIDSPKGTRPKSVSLSSPRSRPKSRREDSLKNPEEFSFNSVDTQMKLTITREKKNQGDKDGGINNLLSPKKEKMIASYELSSMSKSTRNMNFEADASGMSVNPLYSLSALGDNISSIDDVRVLNEKRNKEEREKIEIEKKKIEALTQDNMRIKLEMQKAERGKKE